jgi:phenylpyruvate tautomerase PptA (4-oxalocrotonate tautomerase family)
MSMSAGKLRHRIAGADMPFLEVFDFAEQVEAREAAGRRMTETLCEAYGIKPEIVTCYFVGFSANAYVHAGKKSEKLEDKRIFIKVHAFARSVDLRRVAARTMTEAAAAAYGVPASAIAIYFFDRSAEDVAHGGILASD